MKVSVIHDVSIHYLYFCQYFKKEKKKKCYFAIFCGQSLPSAVLKGEMEDTKQYEIKLRQSVSFSRTSLNSISALLLHHLHPQAQPWSPLLSTTTEASTYGTSLGSLWIPMKVQSKLHQIPLLTKRRYITLKKKKT